MAGELLTRVDEIEKRLERLEKAISKLNPGEFARIWAEIQYLHAKIRR
jgi:hypothetical protein